MLVTGLIAVLNGMGAAARHLTARADPTHHGAALAICSHCESEAWNDAMLTVTHRDASRAVH
jgi:hypothetical protein